MGREQVSVGCNVNGAVARRNVVAGALLGMFSFAASPCAGQIVFGSLEAKLEDVAIGLVSPISLTHAGDGSGRLFVVDQAGKILVIKGGQTLPTPFLDLTSKIVTINTAYDERGVLGLAFHPDFGRNGRFFVRYGVPRAGAPDEPCNDPKGFIVGCHKEVLAEYRVSEGNPDVADPASEVILFEVDKPQFNHNGGHVAFGPDGFLYFGLGDGGGANDGLADTPPSHGPIGNGQNIETPLGALLRIDVNGAPPFQVPPDNPFVGKDGLDAIYAYGLRNPYRFSFDRATGELLVADVGQNQFEELDLIAKGGNYGWAVREGAHCFDPFHPSDPPPASCPTEGLIDPIAEYDHSQGLAIVGGYVYRGNRYPQFLGKYLFGDFTRDFTATGRLLYIDFAVDRSRILELKVGPGSTPSGFFVKGFGEGEDGEIYVLATTELGPGGTTGKVLHISGALPFRRGDSNADGRVDLSDAIHELLFLFLGSPNRLNCKDASDSSGDGTLDLTDPIVVLNYLFLGEGPPPAPGPAACGLPPSFLFGCEAYPAACGSFPQITSGPTAVPAAINEGESTSLSVTVTDSGGDPLSYSWTQVAPASPSGNFSNASAQNPTWTAPSVTADTGFTLRVIASDGKGAEAQGDVLVSVKAIVRPPSYAADIQPIFTNNCSCHMGGFPSAGMNLGAGQSYANLVNVAATACSPLKRVLPNDPDNSVLMKKISGTACGFQMPLSNPSFFDQNPDLLLRIRSWIQAGAPNN